MISAAAPELRLRLEQLLSESEAAVVSRQSQAFDRAASPFAGRIVIYGAGQFGRRILRGLRNNGADALAFADRNPALWSHCMDGIPVLSPEEAVQRFGADAAFVIAVWHPVAEGGLQAIAAELSALGCPRVIPFPWLCWKYPAEFLPNFLWDLPSHIIEAAADVRHALDLFPERRSQAEFLSQLEFRLTGNFGCLQEPDGGRQYFPRDIFRPRDDEYFVDCGAYTGDTLLEMAEWIGGRFRGALALEADPVNFAALERTVECDQRLRGRVRALSLAVGRERCALTFAASGLSSASISADGNIQVECAPLDEILADESPTYIKMDIEGSERDALLGADAVIRRSRPALAICLYHLQDHLWRIPSLIHQQMPDATLFLRPYCVNGFELVCYAVPPERAMP